MLRSRLTYATTRALLSTTPRPAQTHPPGRECTRSASRRRAVSAGFYPFTFNGGVRSAHSTESAYLDQSNIHPNPIRSIAGSSRWLSPNCSVLGVFASEPFQSFSLRYRITYENSIAFRSPFARIPEHHSRFCGHALVYDDGVLAFCTPTHLVPPSIMRCTTST